MKKILFLLSMLTMLAFTVISCDDNQLPTKPDTGGDTNTMPKSYSFTGEWREVGSNAALGKIVVFTDTTATAWSYEIGETGEIDGIEYTTWHLPWFNDIGYLLNDDTVYLSNSNTLVLMGCNSWTEVPLPSKTQFKFHSKDTLYMQDFISHDPFCLMPYHSGETTLYRYVHDNTISIVGEWHEIGSTETVGRIVTFTDTTVTARTYRNNYVDPAGDVRYAEYKWFNDTKYLLDNNTLVMLNHNVPGIHYTLPFKTHFTFHSSDTLYIRYFVFNDTDVAFPSNASGITLYRRK
jgi:hypothetical protein